MGDNQIVVVGHRMLCSANWWTFHDFLRDLLFDRLGHEWLARERAKHAADRHRIVRWYDQAIKGIGTTAPTNTGIYVAPMTGAVRAFINLAYNIYLIAHHTGPAGDKIIKSYIGRLKSARADDFRRPF